MKFHFLLAPNFLHNLSNDRIIPKYSTVILLFQKSAHDDEINKGIGLLSTSTPLKNFVSGHTKYFWLRCEVIVNEFGVFELIEVEELGFLGLYPVNAVNFHSFLLLFWCVLWLIWLCCFDHSMTFNFN